MSRSLAQKWGLSALALLGLVLSSPASGFDIGYGGRLTSSAGEPLTGPLSIVFHFFRSESDPTPLVSVTAPDVPLSEGVFQVSLALTPSQLDSVLGDGSQKVYIQVEAGGRFYPKQLFMYAPLALRVPVDNDTLVFENGTLKVGTISASQVQGLSASLGQKTSQNTPSSIVMRDGSGNFSAGTITADLNGDVQGDVTANVIKAADSTGSNVTGTDLTVSAGNGTGTGGSGSIRFNTASPDVDGTGAGTLATRMTIDQNGNVGIGTGYPTAVLDVNGTLKSSGLSIGTDGTDSGYMGYSYFRWGIWGGPGLDLSDLNDAVGVIFRQSDTFITKFNTITAINGALSINVHDFNAARSDVGPNSLAALNVANTGNIGIGTSAPDQPLVVAGIIRSSTGGFMFPDGSTMTSSLPTPSSGYSSTTDLNMAADFGGNGTGNMVMSTRGAERMRITNSGNIGVGSTAPGTKVEVVSGAAASGMRVLSGSASNWTGYALGRTGTEAVLGIAGGANNLATGASAGDLILRTETASQKLMFSSGGATPTLAVDSMGVSVTGNMDVSGNLGVGVTNPSQTLEVAGIIKSGSGGFMFPDGTVMTSAVTAGTSGASSTTDLNLVADSGVAGTGDVILSTRGSERVRVTNSGNVGIGTSMPGDELMVRSAKDSSVTPQLPGLAVVDSSVANSGVGGGIALWGNYTGNTPIAGATIHALKNTATAGDTGFNLAFNTRANGAGLTEKMRITGGGNVGIGTVAPSARFQVTGGAIRPSVGNLATAGIHFPPDPGGGSGDEAYMRYFVTGGENTKLTIGIGNDLEDAMGFIQAGSERLSISRGNVGIGTTNPTQMLDVTGVVRASGGFMFADGTVMTTAASGSAASSGNISSETNVTLAAGSGEGGGGSVSLYTGGSERMRIASDGNVGIGTTAPGSQLDLVDSAGLYGIGLPNTPGATMTFGGRWFSASTTVATLGGVRGWHSANNGVMGGGVQLSYSATGSATLTPGLTLNHLGNVGIGTTIPAGLLDLARGSSGSSTEPLIVRNAGATTPANTGTGVAFALTSTAGARHAAINALVSNASTGATDLTLSTSSGGVSATEKVRIQAGGFVGIGTTSPANMLSVAGGADFTGNVGIGSAIPTQALDVAGVIRSSAGGIMFPDGTTMTTAATAGTGTSSTADLNFAADSDANSSGEITWATRGSERMRISNGGNVGIGTSVPAGLLDVNGRLTVLSSGNVGLGTSMPTQQLTITQNALLPTAVSNTNGNLFFGGDTSTGANGMRLFTVSNMGYIDVKTSSGANGLAFRVDTSIGAIERMRITAGGNVGIGTTAPSNRLSVVGSSDFTGNVGIGSASPTQALDVAGSIKISSVSGALIFPDGTSMTTAAAASTGSASSTDLALAADSDGDGTGVITLATRGAERLRVDSSGNIGIGTTAPTSLLTLQTASSLDGINLVGSSTSSSSPAYSLYDGATERGVFGYAAAASRWSSSAASGDIVLRATSGKLLLQTGTADATMTLNSGNVGIGTTAPISLLDVSGNRFATPSLTGAYLGFQGATLTDSATAASGTIANAVFHSMASPMLAATHSSVTTTNAYTAYIGGAPRKGTNNTVTNAVALGIGAATVTGQTNSYGLLVNAQAGATNNFAASFLGGNVGIGSVTPTQRLDVAGAIRSSSGGFVFPDGTVMTTAITSTTAGTSSTTDLNLAADTEATGNGAIIMSTGTVERMRVTNGGNVGIGTSTPSGLLDVNGAFVVTSSGNVGISTTTPRGRLSLGTATEEKITLVDNATASSRLGLGIASNDFRSFIGTSSNFFTFRQGGYSGTELMRLTGGGNLGIGTSTPANRLSVQGSANVSGRIGIGTTTPSGLLDVLGSANSESSARILNTHSGSSALASLRILNDGISPLILFLNSSTRDTDGGANAATLRNDAGALRLQSAGASGIQIAATSGNVGIGSADPSYKLDVVGDINTSTCVRIAGTQQLGTCASDERFKKDIQPIRGALAKLRLLNPVHYEFRTEEFPERRFSHGVESGLIAQDVERIFPHLVVTDPDGYKRVSYGLELEMHTIAALKELALENDRLRERADKAEAEVVRLHNAAAALKAESSQIRDFLCRKFPDAPICRS